MERAFVKVLFPALSLHPGRKTSLASGKTGLTLSPSGISKHRHCPSLLARKKKLNHDSVFTVAASAIQIECFSSDDDEDGPRSDVSVRDCRPCFPRF